MSGEGWGPTFEDGTEFPDGERTQAGVLSNRDFKTVEWNTAYSHTDEIRDQEGTWKHGEPLHTEKYC